MIKPEEIESLRHTEYNSDPVIMEMLDTLERLWKVAQTGEEVSGQLGVHPAQWQDMNNPENGYSQRTPEMEEENRQVIAFMEAIANLHRESK